MPAASGSTRRRNRARRNAGAARDRSANQESAPASRNIIGIPQGKQKAVSAVRTTLFCGLLSSQLVSVKGSAEW